MSARAAWPWVVLLIAPVGKIVAHTWLLIRMFRIRTAGVIRPPMSKVRPTRPDAVARVIGGRTFSWPAALYRGVVEQPAPRAWTAYPTRFGDAVPMPVTSN